MKKHRAIPQGYMTVGEVAKKMGVTVRTMQYYDKVGLLPPSSVSEGGRRLYTHEEIIKLHQIQSMKRLGYTLEEIKAWMPSANTPEEVSSFILEQAKVIRDNINSLTESLESIEKLNEEILQTKTVDWEKYADILYLLQTKNPLYWAVKHYSDTELDCLSNTDEIAIEALIKKQNRLFERANELQRKGVLPDSEQGQDFAKEFWDVTMELTGGDTSSLLEFSEIAHEHGDSKWKNTEDFISNALDLYLTNQGCNPFNEVEEV